MRKRKPPKEPRVKMTLTILQKNYEYLLSYIAEEEGRGLKITPSRAINALLSQARTGTTEPDEHQFRARRRCLTKLLRPKHTFKAKTSESTPAPAPHRTEPVRQVSSKMSTMTEEELLAAEEALLEEE